MDNHLIAQDPSSAARFLPPAAGMAPDRATAALGAWRPFDGLASTDAWPEGLAAPESLRALFHAVLAETLNRWQAARDDARPTAERLAPPCPVPSVGTGADRGPTHAESPADVPTEPLSLREREVLELVARGASNKVIARALGLSPHTVKRHVANILGKLGLHSRVEAAAWRHAGN